MWKCILKIKNILTAGLNKAVYGACDQESKKKKNSIFEYAKLDFCKKNC